MYDICSLMSSKHQRNDQHRTTFSTPLVSHNALRVFTLRLVENFAPEKVILTGSKVRDNDRWDSVADIIVVIPYEVQPLDTVIAIRSACNPEFP